MGRVVVIGSGRMAPGIAAACSAAGEQVVIAARDEARAAAAAGAAGAGVESRAFVEGAFAGAWLAIETIVEDPAVKRELYAVVEPWLAEDAVLASNTSSLAIGGLAAGLARPGRLAGLHFMNPAELTSLVEVVPGPATTPETIELLADLARRMGKSPLVLNRDIPGFIWNRIQFAVLRECLHLLDEGVADAETIDAAIADGLAPRWIGAGPLATAELGGLDTFSRASQQLFPELTAETEVSPTLAEGFYAWDEESRKAVDTLRRRILEQAKPFADDRRQATPRSRAS